MYDKSNCNHFNSAADKYKIINNNKKIWEYKNAECLQSSGYLMWLLKRDLIYTSHHR